ncbi:BON domain-containing protein [Fluviicola chungangensis]|uniref:BON domain-containing protein n=1 Tax=Fluviicola chungangensis TaxID=2597671 RepID=A0A556MYG4_9FLAO|nr:BON domain-containing protein [Fluviicola chungangensis]TSJ44961.1 BON domain-containing protein [Fluviicola chungangensis]
MKTNEQLQKDVQDTIKWEPLLKAAEIGVIVKDGIVTLTGTVDNYAKKLQAEKAAKSVIGVKALVEELEVKFANSQKKDDGDIAEDVLFSLRTDLLVPDEKIQAKVENGWVTLDGEVHWDFQREAAKRSIEHITGVRGVFNHLKIRSELNDDIEQRAIEAALHRSWAVNDKDIRVHVQGRTVKLTGTVASLYQKEEAGRIAWKTPGIWHVDNELEVDYEYAVID